MGKIFYISEGGGVGEVEAWWFCMYAVFCFFFIYLLHRINLVSVIWCRDFCWRLWSECIAGGLCGLTWTAFAAVRKSKIGNVVELAKDERIKNKKVKIAVAK